MRCTQLYSHSIPRQRLKQYPAIGGTPLDFTGWVFWENYVDSLLGGGHEISPALKLRPTSSTYLDGAAKESVAVTGKQGTYAPLNFPVRVGDLGANKLRRGVHHQLLGAMVSCT